MKNEVVTVSPFSLSFGQVAVGSTSTLPVLLTNNQSKNETLGSLVMIGSGYSASGPAIPLPLSPGQSATLKITFAPQSAGLDSGSLLIEGPFVDIPLSGTGATVGQLTPAPTALSFGNVDVGSTTHQPLTMTASGGSVTISCAASSSSQFTIPGATFPLTINAGTGVQLNVAFSPTGSGRSSGKLTFCEQRVPYSIQRVASLA